MDASLRQQTKDRIAEIDDLAGKLASAAGSTDQRRVWLGELRDRTQLLRNLLDGALASMEGPIPTAVHGHPVPVGEPGDAPVFDITRWDDESVEELIARTRADFPELTDDQARVFVGSVLRIVGRLTDEQTDLDGPENKTGRFERREAPLTPEGHDVSPNTIQESEAGRQR